jgi:hypothetical protein
MSNNISKTTVCSIRNLINSEQKPHGMTATLLRDVKMGIKFNILTRQRIFLEDCLRMNVCPNEIVSTARSIERVNRVNNDLGRRCVKQEKRILRIRQSNASREARMQKTVWEASSREASNVVNLSVEGRNWFKHVKEAELRRVWEETKVRHKKKLRWLTMKQKKDRGDIPDTFREVLITDEILAEAFGNEDPEPRIYGGIEASDNVMAFMKLPSNLRRFQKMDLITEEVKAEITATTQRWTIREMEDEGEERLTVDERKIKKDNEAAERKICDGVKVDFGKVRATEMPHNKLTYMPKQAEIREEIKIQNQRIETIDEVKKYMKEKCDEDGNIIGAENLTEAELAGLDEIREGIKNNEWMLYNSDKSGFMVLDTKSNFLESMKSHYEGDIEATIANVVEAEKNINNTARVIADILCIGKDVKHGKRCKDTLISNMTVIPNMQGFRKDHKANVDNDPNKGPPLRPLCAANKSLNAPLGCVLSKILKCVGDEKSVEQMTEILSTEELCRAVEDVTKNIATETEGVEYGDNGNNNMEDSITNVTNIMPESVADNNNENAPTRTQPKRHCKKKHNEAEKEKITVAVTKPLLREQKMPRLQKVRSRVVGSMDAKALYPSIVAKMAGDASGEAIVESTLEFKNIDVNKLAKLVAMKVPRDVIEENGLKNVVPIPKGTTTFNSFANPRGNTRKVKGVNQFYKTREEASKAQEKMMIGMVVDEAVKECMENHYYRIGGKIYRQSKGGSIGSTLTGETSRVYMLKWDKLFLRKLKKLKIKVDLYKRYVDDITVVLNAIAEGWVYNVTEDRMEFKGDELDNARETEDGDNDEVRTFKILQAIANSVCPEIQMTFDVPSLHKNKKLPVLDLDIWIGMSESGHQTVRHTFYKKSVSSPYTILERSAISASVKRNTHLQEALRRMKCCDSSAPWIDRAFHLSGWCNMLRISGYNVRYRFNILKGAILRYEEMRRLESVGEIENYYRNRKQMTQATIMKGGKASASTWFMRGETTSVLGTAATPASSLRDKLQEMLNTIPVAGGGRTKAIEASGAPIYLGLKKTDPFASEGCDYGDPECIVDSKTSCSSMAACYRIVCSMCECEGNSTNTTVSDTVTVRTSDVVQAPAGPRTQVIAGSRRRNRNSTNTSSATVTATTNSSKNKKKKNPNKEVVCMKSNYIGTSGRTLHSRGIEHSDAIRRKDIKNAMAKHSMNCHGDSMEDPVYTMVLMSKHRSNLERLIMEGILIEKQWGRFLVNLKGEWGRDRGMVRLTAMRI